MWLEQAGIVKPPILFINTKFFFNCKEEIDLTAQPCHVKLLQGTPREDTGCP